MRHCQPVADEQSEPQGRYPIPRNAVSRPTGRITGNHLGLMGGIKRGTEEHTLAFVDDVHAIRSLGDMTWPRAIFVHVRQPF